MKILISNKFYYRRGGDCIYTINLEELLKTHGHEVAIFAMQHPATLSTIWSKYFPREIKFVPGLNMIEAIMRPFGTSEVKKKFNALLNDFNPDIVHLNNIHSQLSPIIAKLAHDKGVKVIWTLHDLKLLCPRYDCLQNGEVICEDCFTDKCKILQKKCMKNSFLASFLAYKEAMKWTRERLEEYTDTFVCPSQFMANKMIKGGFKKDKIAILCNFIDINKCQKDNYTKEDYYCFIGRISHEKGIKTLIEVANKLPYKLIIIGEGPWGEKMQEIAQPNIKFIGFKQWNDIKEIVGKARFSVIPSECYENNPLSVIEAQCLGTPVLGARIGGIPELIEEGISGMLFNPKDKLDLEVKIKKMISHFFDYQSLAQQAQEKYNANSYFKELMKLYK